MKNKFYQLRHFTLIFLAAVVFQSTSSQAAGRCVDLFNTSTQMVINSDPVQQLILWEQTSNQTRWHKPTEKVQLAYTEIHLDDVVVRAETYTPEIIHSFFKTGNRVLWLKHPLNKSREVPYLNDHEHGHKEAFFSASRSMFTKIEGSLFSFKLPTDHPHPNANAQREKADLKNDSIISMRRSKHIREFDAVHKKADNIFVLTEVISIASKQGNAFSVRDLRPLQDGNYYLPAFSIPYAGREIAEMNKADFNEFWKENYGALLGKAKAQLLLRYGLQMKTPNAQNWLIQLDKKMIPTGKIYMRDVADSNYVEFIADHNGSFEQIQADRMSNFTTAKRLFPNWENSAWQMSEGLVSEKVLQSWGIAHDTAYISAIQQTLKLDTDFKTIEQLELFLKSSTGIDSLYYLKSSRGLDATVSISDAA